MTPSNRSFFSIASARPVVRVALKMALVVGTILAAINHGPNILAGTVPAESWVQIALTYFVPYGVSTYSSVKAIQQKGV